MPLSTFEKPFSDAEHGRRVLDTKRRMQKAGCDLIVCCDPANMCWLTGFDGWSFYVPQAVLVHLEEEHPVWFGRAQDAKAAHVTTSLPAKNIVPFSEPLVHHPIDHPFDELVDLIRGRGWATARIGVEMDAHYYTARCHTHLVEGLPDAKISSNQELVNWARLVKSETELALMRTAGEICTAAMNRAIERVAPGVPQNEIIADIYHAQMMGVAGAGGDYTSLCPLIQVGEGTSTPHLTWSDIPLPDDTLVMLELAGVRRRYHAPLTRTIYLGRPPRQIADLAKVVIEGGDAAIAAARPGTTCEEVEAVWQRILKRNGLKKESRVGYSIGLNYPPDWGERTASLRPGDETVLRAGMCFHFQSGMWMDDHGAAISESFVVTDNGGERLCDVARELIIVD
ncbi:MAG: M24 family metallopeptidase [Gammaproteobacteria bacterium]